MTNTDESAICEGSRVWVRPQSWSIQRDYGRRFPAVVVKLLDDDRAWVVPDGTPPENTIGVGLSVVEPRQ